MEELLKHKIREIAADVFGRYPRANRVAVTADGQAFITDDGEAAAMNHARANRYKEQLEIISFDRSEFEAEPEGKPKNDYPKVAPAPKVVKSAAKRPAAKKTIVVKEDAKIENPAVPNESEKPKKEES